MSLCLNFNCVSPRNQDDDLRCHHCASPLVLHDRYRATRILGQGGFGTTFLAQDEGLPGNPLCVIKQMRPPSTSPAVKAKSRELFEREAKTLGKLGNNPQITRLLDFFESGDGFYLVQEYVDGQTLQAELHQQGPFPEAATREVLTDVLRILAYLHEQKVIHRDIKPANIIRRAFDQRLVLIDFGIVKDQVGQTAMLEAVGEGANTQFAIGTLGFAPPEQLAKRPVYASDIYSLGATCLFLLSGIPPTDYAYDPITGELEWPDSLQVSAGFKDILKKMVAESVRDRFTTVAAVQTALAKLDQPIGNIAAPAKVTAASQEGGVAVAVAPAIDRAPLKLHPKEGITPSNSKEFQEALAKPARSQRGTANAEAQELERLREAMIHFQYQAKATADQQSQRSLPWWNRPLIGKRSLTQRITRLFIKLPISERSEGLHDLAFEKLTALAAKAETVDSEKFGSQEFLAYVRLEYAMGKGTVGFEHLTKSAELLRVGIKSKNAFLKIEQTEVGFRGTKQNQFYDQVQSLLSQKLDKASFLAQTNAKMEALLPQLKSTEGKNAMQSYLQQLELIGQHELGLQLLSLFKQYQLSNYSVLQTISEIVASLSRQEVYDLKSLAALVAADQATFEKLGQIIGLPQEKRTPETYSILLQYLALSEKYQVAYAKFQQLTVILEQWIQYKETVIAIRQEYSPKEYKQPKKFRLTLPGVEIYDKYHEYFENKSKLAQI